jgi:hypothetical protein
MLTASTYEAPFVRIKMLVLPVREKAAKQEEEQNRQAMKEKPKARLNRHHGNFLKRWWLMSYPRDELIEKIRGFSRFITCSRHTKRPVFEFVDSSIRPGDALQVLAFEDDYSFGIVQSNTHWRWFSERCSTIKRDPRYTPTTVFDSFPWPQAPTKKHARAIADAGIALRHLRTEIMKKHGWGLRDLYRKLDLPGENPVRDAQEKLDAAVRAAYGMKKNENPLRHLLDLNHRLAEMEAKGQPIVGPGLPPCVKQPSLFVTQDCIRADALAGQ